MSSQGDPYRPMGEWEAERQRRRFAIGDAILEGQSNDAIVGLVWNTSISFDSCQRLPMMLPPLRMLPASCFCRGFEKVWSNCDDTWDYRRVLLNTLRRHQGNAPARQSGDPSELLCVYRGCSADRVRGVSWSLSREVAEGFARGHRRIRVPDSVVATALIRRGGTFMIDQDSRGKREVLLDPRRLRRIEVEPYLSGSPLPP